MKTYSEKLKDPRWQKKRLEIMNRDIFICQGCYDDKSTLTVHHLWYDKNKEPWDYPNSCYVTLCEDCHSQEHDKDYDKILNKKLSDFKHCGLMVWMINDLVATFFDFVSRNRPISGEEYSVINEVIYKIAKNKLKFYDLSSFINNPERWTYAE